MDSFCSADCLNCGFGKTSGCKGCMKSGGCPFGTPCFIANYIKTGGIETYHAMIGGRSQISPTYEIQISPTA